VYVATERAAVVCLGEERELPTALTRTDKRGVPVGSILLSTVIGLLAFGPFKSWAALVNVITAATAIMYAFAPVSLAALQKIDAGRRRTYRAPMPKLLLPAAFARKPESSTGAASTPPGNWLAPSPSACCCSCSALAGQTGALRRLRSAIWIGPWLVGQVVIGWLGRYGDGARNILPGGSIWLSWSRSRLQYFTGP
jgi:amino acid transporter